MLHAGCLPTEQERVSELSILVLLHKCFLRVFTYCLQQSECSLNPVSGATQRYPDTDPVSGNVIPLICSKFDAHKIVSATVSKF